MSYGDIPKQSINNGAYHSRVPGLRDSLPPSPCKVYKVVDGKMVLVRIEKVR